MSTMNIYDLSDVWNAGGTTFTAVKMNVTDTASAATSMLIDLQVGGTSQFHVLKNGAIHTKRSNYNITNTNAASILVSNYSLTGSDATSMFDLAGTWNTSGTPAAIKLNMTDTASNAASALMDLQVGGVSQFSVTKAGVFRVTDAVTAFVGTAIPAGGTTGAGLKVSSTANFGVFFGSGAPTLSAAKGSLYMRSDGSGVNDRMYVNTDGSTSWTAVVTVG